VQRIDHEGSDEMQASTRRESPSSLLEAGEATRLAQDLAERHGRGALDLARARAARTIEIGDDLAYGAWQAVIVELRDLLGPTTARPLAAASAYRRPALVNQPSLVSLRGLS